MPHGGAQQQLLAVPLELEHRRVLHVEVPGEDRRRVLQQLGKRHPRNRLSTERRHRSFALRAMQQLLRGLLLCGDVRRDPAYGVNVALSILQRVLVRQEHVRTRADRQDVLHLDGLAGLEQPAIDAAHELDLLWIQDVLIGATDHLARLEAEVLFIGAVRE